MPPEELWLLRRRGGEEFRRRLAAAGYDPLLAQILYARHVDTPEGARAFLAGEGSLGDPLSLAGMEQAVERLLRALRTGEKIVIYGDFDVDGVSATALLVSALKLLGGNVGHYIPPRVNLEADPEDEEKEEGYGLNTPALERLRREGVGLVVTVDCGIRSYQEVALAQARGLDIILTDHHTVPAELPPAVAVINPKRAEGEYPYRELAGVGVAHRLAEALWRAAGRGVAELEQFLDLVAVGTIGDIVPLTGENRLLARWGLERLRRAPRPGLRALMEVSGTRPDEVDSRAIAFRLAPRLNAAGRLETAQRAYRLLTTASEEEAQQLATELNAINQRRQELLEEQLRLARESLAALDGQPLLLVAGAEYHHGIVGLIASRLLDEFYRPALVMRRDERSGTTRGSARSVEGFHITQALDACRELLLRYGGHARAAGFTLANDKLELFCRRLLDYSAAHLPPELLRRRRHVDAIVPLAELTEATPGALAALEPLGEGNPEPALAALNVKLMTLQPVGQGGKHLRLQVSDGQRVYSGIAFRRGAWAGAFQVGQRVDIVFRPELDTWQGELALQLVVEAMRPSRSDSCNGKE